MGEYRPGHLHAGVDIRAPKGTKIYPVVNGVVDTIGSYYVKIEGSDGKYYDYIHINHSSSLSKGMSVYKNQLLQTMDWSLHNIRKYQKHSNVTTISVIHIALGKEA